MDQENPAGWKKLLEGYPWFAGEGKFPISAYSEFMPPPRLGKRPYSEIDISLFREEDPCGWYVSEVEEEYELRPGIADLVRQIEDQVVELGQGGPAHNIAGHERRNLANNPYWPPELEAQAGKLSHERYVMLLPAALSKTQDDKGRVRWTFFGASEQGPELAFWKSFYSGPQQELSPAESASFILRLLSEAFGEEGRELNDLHAAGFGILPSEFDPRFPYWREADLPSWTDPFVIKKEEVTEKTRYLLTFRSFSRLPETVRERYLSGQLILLPFPGSLAFWGMPSYIKLQEELPLAIQASLQRVAARHGGPGGIRVPQSGWFYEPGRNFGSSEVQQGLLLNRYKRTHRWDRVYRHENEVVLSTIEDSVARVLFSTDLDTMGLYGKPMARNCQLWNPASRLLLDGPEGSQTELEKAALAVAEGGSFRYRFQFPAMQVGSYEVFWQRPLIGYLPIGGSKAEIMTDGPAGYLTAYPAAKPDLAHPLELWPRLARREAHLLALRNFEHLREHYTHQTALNVIRFLDTWELRGERPLSRSLARQVLRIPEREPLEEWLKALPDKAENPEEGNRLREILEGRLEAQGNSGPQTSLPGEPAEKSLGSAITYSHSAVRAFEEAWWRDISLLSAGEFINKDNADCADDPQRHAIPAHHWRDLEAMGDYLTGRHRLAVEKAGMQASAICGELPFKWTTDYDFSPFGGWKNNQDGHTHERDVLLMIPGKNRRQAIIMADHYDTAYMEDLYDKARGGKGLRISAAGADDNCSATATLLQAAPIFLELSKEGRLERDIWLVHLTGEEFPADCMGARHLAQALVERNLRIYGIDGKITDLSDVDVKGAFVLDMVGHNLDSDMDQFQISPGQGRESLDLACLGHWANALWNMGARGWNHAPERTGKERGRRTADRSQIPAIARFPLLQGEVRLSEDPRSSLFNTDGQIFSDCGIPVVLFMENYDINRSGYHDTKDTMENIDLDYGSALAAIAIETVARAACQLDFGAAPA